MKLFLLSIKELTPRGIVLSINLNKALYKNKPSNVPKLCTKMVLNTGLEPK